jgi:structure-specific recognition protein 1
LQTLVDALLQHTDAGVATSDDSIADIGGVSLVAPRGRFDVEMHASFIKLKGQVRLFEKNI